MAPLGRANEFLAQVKMIKLRFTVKVQIVLIFFFGTRMWWTLTGNYGNILPIDWSKSTARRLQLPTLQLRDTQVRLAKRKPRSSFVFSCFLLFSLATNRQVKSTILHDPLFLLSSQPPPPTPPTPPPTPPPPPPAKLKVVSQFSCGHTLERQRDDVFRFIILL